MSNSAFRRRKPVMITFTALLAATLFSCSQPQSSSSSSNPATSSPSDSTSSPISSGSDDDKYSEIVETHVTADGYTTGNLSSNGKYYSDYASLADEQQAAKETAVQISEEGDVLLKNADDCLPLKTSENHLTCFGMHSVNLITAGGGSGAGKLGNNGITASTLESSLTDAGYKVNPSTLSLYSTYQSLGTINNELPIKNYTPSTISSYFGYGDAAVVTISRQGTENKDLATNNVEDHANADDHTLQLDDNETALIKHVKTYFKKVIVLINSSNIMQIPELAEDKTDSNLGVDAILWIGGVGNNGVDAVGEILNGSVCPSGHTSDLWTRDFTKDPSFTNFGFDTQNKDSDGNRMDSSYYDKNGKITNYNEVEYREGIYNGYKYYETAANDMTSGGEAWYQDNVLYPFGYGLSYTTFDWEWAGVKDGLKIDSANQTVTTRVKVTNTGKVAGKDVVQIYFSAPYTKGGIEKASTNLVNFGKTDILQPGESQVLTIQFVAQDMASFDDVDKNNNSFKGYELEKGDYTITANRDSHTPVLSTTRKISEDIKCTTDYTTGKEIKPIFTGEYASTNTSLTNNSISRATGLTQPKAATVADRTLSDETLAEYDDQDIYNHNENKASDPWYQSSVPTTWKQDSKDTSYTLADMSGVDYQDGYTTGSDNGSKKWENYMNQLSWTEMCDIVSGDSSNGMASGRTNYSDGPVQISGGTLFPSNPILSATYNVDLAYKKGRFVGNEAIFLGLNAWAGPGMDTHRSPFSGRNFEYYSQDGYHAARFAEASIKGATSKGLICYAKHFFLNDQESFRADYGGVFTWCSEQAIRENYLKPFEYAIKAGSMGAMSSFNRIGKQVTATSYAVHQYLLRDEWDSKAAVITDAWAKAYVPVNKMSVAGSDMLLGTSSSYSDNSLDHGEWDSENNTVKIKGSDTSTDYDTASPTLYAGIRTRAQRNLYTRANSTAAKNGVTTGQNLNVTLEKGVSNNVAIEVSGTNDVNVTLADGATMPDGLTIKNGRVVSGKPTVEGTYSVNVNLAIDGWVTSTAVLNITVKSAMHYNGEAVSSTGTTATISTNQAYEGKINVPALAYGNTVASDIVFWGSHPSMLIVNYYTDHGTNYNRNEDKTASDIITIDADKEGIEKHEYGYSITSGNLPEGITAEPVMKDWTGKANRGSYQVVDYYKLSGTPTKAGTYTFDITLTCPETMMMSGWLFASFGSATVTYTQTITLVVA
jgi:beta-glucosidase